MPYDVFLIRALLLKKDGKNILRNFLNSSIEIYAGTSSAQMTSFYWRNDSLHTDTQHNNKKGARI